MRRYLVVANQTLGGEHLKAKVRECMAAGDCTFTIVVPATPPADHLTWTESQAQEMAEQRLAEALARFREMGATVDGVVGDPRPMQAIIDAVETQPFDEIILSTLPPGLSRWLRQDLPTRVASRIPLPVTHVIAEQETATTP
jgi:nucleotide-binding universal stress UspA family protein